MMNTLKKMVLLGAFMLGFGQVSEAVLTSTNTNVIGGTPVFSIKAKESVTYIIGSTGSAAGVTLATVTIQYADKGNNWVTEVTTAPSCLPLACQVTNRLDVSDKDRRYRFNVTGSSGGKVYLSLYDNDDFVNVVKDNEGDDIVTVNDESFRIQGLLHADGYRLENSSNSLSLSSTTVIAWRRATPSNKVQTQNVSSELILDKSFTLLGSTGTSGGNTSGGIVLASRPHISTETAVNGDIVMFQGAVSSVTFTSNNSLAGSGVLLGASTRALGIGDILGLIYFDGFWREFFFANNLQP